jgi:mono/diheme cytochrome c family protein
MNRASVAVVLLAGFAWAPFVQAQDASKVLGTSAAKGAAEFQRSIEPVLKAYCHSCHGEGAREGGLALEKLDPRVAGGRDIETWRIIYERVKFGEMPPPEAEQPTDMQRDTLLARIRAELLKTQRPRCAQATTLDLPRYGNHVDHAALFHDEAGPVIPGPPRVWRLRPQIYRDGLIGDIRATGSHQLSDPLNVASGREFKDYASRYFIDEPTTGQLLANAEKVVRIKSRPVLEMLTAGDGPPAVETVTVAIRRTFVEILHREPAAKELRRFRHFHRNLLDTSGKQLAAERLLIAVYMQPEALFREELGAGPPDEHGRVRLAQREIAFALSYALGNTPDEMLLEAARNGELATQQQVAAHVRRRFDLPPEGTGNPRILQFFREYFDYPHAMEVFKNPPKRGSHLPHMLTTDLDLLIEHVVEQDQDVLFQLLTTNEYFVDCRRDPDTGTLRQASLDARSRDDLHGGRNPEHAVVYGLPRDWIWTDQQPVALPRHMRAGVLTHPAWLIAWSGNFDNHPVQRGRWIRTHLLGGTVPDLPIGVDATVPEDNDKQFRERITIATASAECQRCHKKMDPLGLPFEQYTHYGRYRVRELDRPVDTSGTIAYVDDPSLVGAVPNPMEMMHRLAQSAHVEQVFVRHAFRYFMGRNETLGDARTLRHAHRAYRENGGSFRALVVSLLSSESFLFRQPDELQNG